MKAQTFFPRPRDMAPHNTFVLSGVGPDCAEGIVCREGKDWVRRQACSEDTFVLNAWESHSTRTEKIGYTRQEDYIKINFWLSGKHTTVLDGYGQHDHDCPEVFITAGPPEMIKVDLFSPNTHVASVALCVLRSFFPLHLGLDPDQLPEPLRAIAAPDARPHSFSRTSLTADLASAARAILAAPFAVRRDPIYSRAKAIELMCLLINRLSTDAEQPRLGSGGRTRQVVRLHDARELINRRYAQDLTLGMVAKDVGLSRAALIVGFRQLFGMSVHEYLQKQRMEHASELLQDSTNTISQIAEAVGYTHACNFSTAFTAYFGCSPQRTRRASR